MEISNNENLKLKNGEVQAVQTQSTAAAESTRQTQAKKPVNMVSDKKVDPETLKNNEIINYMNSDKFKKLSEEEQLKYFKEHYCTGLTDEQTSAMFTNAKKLAAEAAQISSVSDGAKTNNAAAKETALTADARKQAEQAVVKELQTVQKTENPSRKDVYEYLLKKETDGAKMTDAEKAVLKTYKSLAEIGHPDFNNAQSASAGAAPSAAVQQTSNELVPMSRVLSSEFLEKSPQEQVTEYMKAYLEKNDPDYAKLSQKEKDKKCSEEIGKIVSTLTGGTTKLGNSTTSKINAYGIMALLTKLDKEGKSLSTLPRRQSALIKKMDIAASQQIKAGINKLFNNNEFKNKSPQEQVLALGEILYAQDKEFQACGNDAEKKALYIDKKIKKECPQFANFTNEQKDLLFKVAVPLLSSFANSADNVTIKGCFNNPQLLYKELYNAMKDDPKYNKTPEFAIIEEKHAMYMAFDAQGIKNPTVQQICDYLEQKKAEAPNNFTEYQEMILKENKGLLEAGYGKTIDPIIGQEVETLKAAYKGDKPFALSEGFKNYTDKLWQEYKENPTIENKNRFLSALHAAGANEESREAIKYLKQLAIEKFPNDKQARNIDGAMGITTLARGNEKLAGEINAGIEDTGIFDTTVKLGHDWLNKNQQTVYNGAILENSSTDKRITEFSSSLNKYYPQKEVVEQLNGIGKLKNISDNKLTTFSQSLVTTASPERQKYYVTEFGKLKNAAVTNGLAAACNSVDNSVKAYYKQALVKAIESGNYTAEQKAGFAKAMKTGTVSSSAEPRTADKAQVSDKAPASAKADTASAAQTAQTSEPQAKVNAAQADLAKETAASAIRDTASSYGLTGSTQASKTSSASSTASAASLSSASSAQSAKEASEAQKEKAMANAASTKEDIDKSVKKWEEEHNTTLTENEIKSLQTAVCAKVVEELLNDPETANSTAEVIHKLVANSTSVTDLYTKLVDIYGTKVKDKFIEILAAKGSSSQVSSFAQNATNSEDIKNLYLKCDNAVLKTELLNMLPPTSVSEMLRKGQIEDLTTIDYKILSAYITDNIGTMSNTEFNKYLQYLPLDERQKLCQLRLKSNPSSAEDSTISGDFAQTVKSDKATAITAQNSASHEEGDAASPFRSGPAQTETDESARLASNGYAYGSDNWLSSIQAKQSGIKVPPSDSYDTEAISFEEDFWDIGSSGSTKVSFNERYDKQKHTGAVYWG